MNHWSLIIVMNSVHPYLLRLQAQFELIAQWKFFEPTAAVIVFLFFFLVGRKSYQSKFTTVLNTINDSQNQRRRLSDLSKKRQQTLKKIKNKFTLFIMATFLIVLTVGAYTYIKQFQPIVVMAAALGLVVFWAVVLIWKKTLEIMIKNTDASLQRKLKSSENDAKEIMTLLGDEVCKQLKTKFQRQLDVQWRAQELKDCDLRHCHDEKSIYKDLYQLYKDILAEMRKMQWCDICSQMLNTDANEIKLAELDSRLKNYQALNERLPLQKKKQLTNRLLEEWQAFEGKLQFMCRRGCCIRFRHVLQDIKKNNHQRLKTLKHRLTLLK